LPFWFMLHFITVPITQIDSQLIVVNQSVNHSSLYWNILSKMIYTENKVNYNVINTVYLSVHLLWIFYFITWGFFWHLW
jgi:hypothetical protein